MKKTMSSTTPFRQSTEEVSTPTHPLKVSLGSPRESIPRSGLRDEESVPFRMCNMDTQQTPNRVLSPYSPTRGGPKMTHSPRESDRCEMNQFSIGPRSSIELPLPSDSKTSRILSRSQDELLFHRVDLFGVKTTKTTTNPQATNLSAHVYLPHNHQHVYKSGLRNPSHKHRDCYRRDTRQNSMTEVRGGKVNPPWQSPRPPPETQTRSHQHGSTYFPKEPSFLSTLTASRPAAARGLLGVASAALAAARAGTFNPASPTNDLRTDRLITRQSKSFDNRSFDSGRPLLGEPDVLHQEWYTSKLDVPLAWVTPSISPLVGRRRNSDSLLCEGSSSKTVQFFICCPTCQQREEYALNSFQDCVQSPMTWEEPWDHNLTTRHASPREKLSETSGQVLPTPRPCLHSSWVELDSRPSQKISDSSMLGDPIKVAMLSRSTEIDDACGKASLRVNRGSYEAEPHRNQSIEDNRETRYSQVPTSSDARRSYGRIKRRGLDTIGLDFMRINGARPGLVPLRNVKELKAAKEMEASKNKPKSSGIIRNSGALGLTSHGTVQAQNPFHQLLSGGVLGATVLAMAGGKEKSPAIQPRDSLVLGKRAPSSSPRMESSNERLVQRHTSESRPVNHRHMGSEDPVVSFHTKQPRGRLSRLRLKLTRSITVTNDASETANRKAVPRFRRVMPASLQGNMSAPGLTRHATEESEDTIPYELRGSPEVPVGTTTNCRTESLTSNSLTTSLHDSFQGRQVTQSDRSNTWQKTPIASFHGTDGLERINSPTEMVVESSSARSRRYFTELATIGSTSSVADDYVNTSMDDSVVIIREAQARRRRDNFQKGRSSAFTWIGADTIGESMIENRPDGEDKQPISSVKSEPGVNSAPAESALRAEREKQLDQGVYDQHLAEEARPRQTGRTFRTQSTNSIEQEFEEFKHPNEIPLLMVEQVSKDEESSDELAGTQRRRDAMNSQLQQRTIRNVGYRLGRRKWLFEKRCRISDFALIFAIFGISVMLLETELTFAGVYDKTSSYSYSLKALISLSTLVLLGLILAYYVYSIKIFSSDDSIEDWRMAVNCTRVVQLTSELLVCLIHPFPGCSFIQLIIPAYIVGPDYTFYADHEPANRYRPPALVDDKRRVVLSSPVSPSRTTLSTPPSVSSTMPLNNASLFGMQSVTYMSHSKLVSIDLILSVPMFFRLYLLLRVMLLHSKLFTDAGSRSIGAMNKVNFDMRFIFKTLMTMCPGRLLLGIILCLWIIYSWSLRACESFYETEHGNLLNSMWLIAVTFLSIGYGDIVPHTYCGRAIALATGVMGSGCTALIVAVFARKLELSKAEKHVIHFMMENKLNKKVKNYAANVLRETWFIYKFTKLAKRIDVTRVRKHQRKLLAAIHGLRRMKMEQRKVQDAANTLVDLAKTQSNIYETVSDLRIEQSCLTHRMERLETTLLKLQDQLRALPGIVRTTILQQHYAYQKYTANRNQDVSPGASFAQMQESKG